VRLNSIKLETFPWQGTYFESVPVELQPLPAPGYRFAGWAGVENADSTVLTTALPEDQEITVTAMFEPDPGAINAIVITEINYHAPDAADPGDWVELHNGWNVPIDLSGWVFKDDQEAHHFQFQEGTVIEPGGYLALCSDKARFELQFPNVNQCVGDFPFRLGNAGDTLRLFDFTGVEVDTVSYKDSAPWPVEPDGSGRTLSLRDVAGENSAAASWTASVSATGTPGKANDGPPLESQNSLRFTSVSVAPDGVVTLMLPTTAGCRYSVQKSADLATWMDWRQVVGSGEDEQFKDDVVFLHSHRFYRAVESE